MFSTFVVLLGILLFFHFLADYPLQGDFLAKAKNHVTPIPNVDWRQALFAHSFIHAGFVFLATGQILFFFGELIAHAYIDYKKNAGDLTFNQDQFLHIGLKVLWTVGVFLIP